VDVEMWIDLSKSLLLRIFSFSVHQFFSLDFLCWFPYYSLCRYACRC